MPDETISGGFLRDGFGRKVYTVKTENAALTANDVRAAGTTIDSLGREHIVLAGLSTGGGAGISVKDSPYSATGDGVADDGPAFNAAIAAIKAAGGGTITVPAGSYRIATPIVATKVYGMVIRGEGTAASGDGVPNLSNDQAVSPMISFLSCVGIAIEQLNFKNQNTSFVNDLVVMDNAPTGPNDNNLNRISRCNFKANVTRGGGLWTCRGLLRLNNTIGSSVEECQFWGGDYGLLLGNFAASPTPPANQGNGYVVNCQFNRCQYLSNNIANVQIESPDLEVSTFRDSIHECIAGTLAAGFIGGASNQCYAINIENNWFGDVGALGGSWIYNLNNISRTGRIVGNSFFTPGGGSLAAGYDMFLKGSAWLVEGNFFNGGGNAYFYCPGSAIAQNIVCISNTFLSNQPLSYPADIVKFGGLTMLGNGGSAPGIQDRTPGLFTSRGVETAVFSGGTHTLAYENGGRVHEFTNAGGATVTVPTVATSGAPSVGWEYEIVQMGAGTVTLSPAGGVTLRANGGVVATQGQYSRLKLYMRATDEWVVSVIPAPTTGPLIISAGNLGAAYTLNCNSRSDVLLIGTLNANCTITPSNMVAGQSITLQLTQDGTGSRTLAFSPAAKTPGGAGLAISTAASATDVLSVYSPDGSALYSMLSGKAMA